MSIGEKIFDLIKDNQCHIQEAPVFEGEDSSFWHSAVVNSCGFPLSGGFAKERSVSGRIAVAEYVEGLEIERIRQDSEFVRKTWGMDRISTGCGFAVGFECKNALVSHCKYWLLDVVLNTVPSFCCKGPFKFLCVGGGFLGGQ